MGEVLVNILFWVGVVLLGAFIVAGLVSPRVRSMLQRPAEEMVRRDRQQWGERSAESEGGRR